jgi:hypothetical protein
MPLIRGSGLCPKCAGKAKPNIKTEVSRIEDRALPNRLGFRVRFRTVVYLRPINE